MWKRFIKVLDSFRFYVLILGCLGMSLLITWAVLHKPLSNSEQLHSAIREQIKGIIQSAVAKKRPTARNLQFQQVHTQSTNKNTIVAHFEYSFEENDVDVKVQGRASIVHRTSTPNHQDIWVVRSIKANRSSTYFKNPIVLLSKKPQQLRVPASNKKSL